jgi:hypothetical protein
MSTFRARGGEGPGEDDAGHQHQDSDRPAQHGGKWVHWHDRGRFRENTSGMNRIGSVDRVKEPDEQFEFTTGGIIGTCSGVRSF